MVLTGDGHRAVLKVNHGLIGPTVAVAHLVGLQARGQAHELVTKADAHHGQAVLDRTGQRGSRCRGLPWMSRVAWAVAAEQGVDGVLRSQTIVLHVGRAPHDVKEHAQMPENVVLHAAIQHTETWLSSPQFIHGARIEFERGVNGHFVDEVLEFRRGQVGQDRFHFVFLLQRSKDTEHRSQFSNSTSDRSRVDVVNARHAVEAEKFVHRPGRMTMVGLVHGVAYDHAFGPYLAGFGGPDVNAVVSDQRIGEREHLARKGRIGERFLIAHHAGGEDQFSRPDGLGTKQFARITPAISGQQHASTGGAWREVALVCQAIGRIGNVEG